MLAENFVHCYHAVAVVCCAVAECNALCVCADESDDEQDSDEEEEGRMPSSRISTSMVKQATAHLHRDGRYAMGFAQGSGGLSGQGGLWQVQVGYSFGAT